jgi:hypothetical protein
VIVILIVALIVLIVVLIVVLIMSVQPLLSTQRPPTRSPAFVLPVQRVQRLQKRKYISKRACKELAGEVETSMELFGQEH